LDCLGSLVFGNLGRDGGGVVVGAVGQYGAQNGDRQWRWRWLVWAEIVTAPLFVADLGADPAPLVSGAAGGYLTLGDYQHFTPLWTVAELRTVLLYGVSLIALIVRYRRSGERERRQLLWLILAVLIAFGVLIPWGVFFAGPVLMLLAIPLIGAAVTVENRAPSTARHPARRLPHRGLPVAHRRGRARLRGVGGAV
jgi:amino acid transporter